MIALSLAAALAATPARPAPAAFSPEAAEHIVGGALASGLAYARLAELTDTVGPRLSGTEGAAAAVQWALKRFGEDGLKAHLEKVRANHWERGDCAQSRRAIPRSSRNGTGTLRGTAMAGTVVPATLTSPSAAS